MIRRWGYSTWAVYSGDDAWGGRLIAVCDSRDGAEALAESVAQRGKDTTKDAIVERLSGKMEVSRGGCSTAGLTPIRTERTEAHVNTRTTHRHSLPGHGG